MLTWTQRSFVKNFRTKFLVSLKHEPAFYQIFKCKNSNFPALSHHMSGQPGFGLHHFIDPRLPFSAAGAFRPIFGSTAAAAAAAAIAASSSSMNTSPLSEAIISQCKMSAASAFQPPPCSKPGQTSPSSTTLFSPGQNLYPRSSAGKID